MTDKKPRATTTDAKSGIPLWREGAFSTKALRAVFLMMMAPGLLWGQTTAQKTDSSPSNSDVAAELKALRETLLQTQKQMASQQDQTQKQMASQQAEIESLKQQLSAKQSAAVGTQGEAPHVVNAALEVPGPSAPSAEEISAPASAAIQPPPPQYGQGNRPIGTFNAGGAEFTLGGFVDLENIYRTTNTGNNIATNFGAIPYSNTTQGQLSEYRLTGQYSRLDIDIKDKVGANDVEGYCEADFSGNDAANVYQIVNGHTLRLRLCFLYLKRGNWEIMGGQTWSWLTPNRDGVGPLLNDLILTYNEDQDVQVGLPYTRAAEFRVAYHLNDHWAMGLGIEDPNQYIGGFVALPEAYSTQLSSQFDNNAQVGAPNLFPDILAKVAYDTEIRGRHFHLEATGLATGVRAGVFPGASAPFSSHSAVGGGGDLASNFALFHNFILLGNAFWSDGGGHYLVVTGPQVVLRPNAAGTNVSPSLVHAGAALGGFEWTMNSKTTLAAYYGIDYYGRDFFPDTTNTAHPGTIIGFGGPGSPNTNNRTVEEATLDLIHAFWKSERFGALQYYTQYSYISRDPWFVAPTEPKNAHLSMVYTGFRYIFPSSSSSASTSK